MGIQFAATRVKRTRTVAGVGLIAALTWDLEIGDVSRFRSVKQAISYCVFGGMKKAPQTKRCALSSRSSGTNSIQRDLAEKPQ
jgi:hypothetical protein